MQRKIQEGNKGREREKDRGRERVDIHTIDTVINKKKWRRGRDKFREKTKKNGKRGG